MTRIMIIRHAEKPSEDGIVRGVAVHGHHDKHALCVRGWQRAGALVRFFAPRGDQPNPLIATPRSIFASGATEWSPSLRSQHTVEPLANELGIAIDVAHAEGDEDQLAQAVLAAPAPVLVAWHHKHIPLLVRALVGGEPLCPRHWPDERFDLVWVLERQADGTWHFDQVPQCLLPEDLDSAA